MDYIVMGLPGSGTTTAVNLMRELQTHLMIYQLDATVEGVNNLIHKHYAEIVANKAKIIVIDTPVIMCAARSTTKDIYYYIQRREVEAKTKILEYVTQLPNCTIVKNDSTPEYLKLQLKKILK